MNLYLSEKAKKKIADYLVKHYPNYLTIIISGSLIDGTADENSDVDLIVIVSDRNQLYNETLQLNDLKLQTFIIPLQHLYERLYADFINARCHFIGLLAKGLHLYGDKQLTKDICEHCAKLKLAGPRPMSSNEHLRTRVHITQLIHKIDNSNEKWENLILDAAQLTEQLIGFKLHSEGAWKGDGKHRMKFIGEHDPNFKHSLIYALNMVYSKKSYKKLSELAKVEIKEKGGFVDFYSKENIQLSPNENFISIHIEFSGDNTNLESSVLTLNHTLLELQRKTDTFFTYYFYKTDISGAGQLLKDVFCIVHADNEWLTSFFIDWLYLQIEQQNLENVSFPSFMDPKYKFATDYLYKEALPIFIKINHYNLGNAKKAFDETFQISSAILILKNLDNIYFNTNSNFEDFLIFMFKSCFIFSYDRGDSITSKELMKRRESTILQFEETYLLQKEALEELWHEENHIILRDELESLIVSISSLKSELDNYPSYSFYLLRGDKMPKELFLLKEIMIRSMEILFIEASYIPYIIYAVLMLKNKSFKYEAKLF